MLRRDSEENKSSVLFHCFEPLETGMDDLSTCYCFSIYHNQFPLCFSAVTNSPYIRPPQLERYAVFFVQHFAGSSGEEKNGHRCLEELLSMRCSTVEMYSLPGGKAGACAMLRGNNTKQGSPRTPQESWESVSRRRRKRKLRRLKDLRTVSIVVSRGETLIINFCAP